MLKKEENKLKIHRFTKITILNYKKLVARFTI